MKLSSIKTDLRLVESGAWVGDIPGLEDLYLKVRPAGTVDAQRAYNKAKAGIPRAKRMTGIDPADERAAMDESLIHAVLIDWSGLEDESGKPIPYSQELARQLITDPTTEAFREGVVWASMVVREIGTLDLQDKLGN